MLRVHEFGILSYRERGMEQLETWKATVVACSGLPLAMDMDFGGYVQTAVRSDIAGHMSS